jgi:predicted TIM-barrel fold metal-dependent hydrolase
MIIDAHVHMGPGLANHQGTCDVDAVTPEQCLTVFDNANIARGVTFAPLYEGGDFVDPDYRKGNAAVHEAAQRFPDRFIPYARVCPNFIKEAMQELRHCIEDYGMQGLMLHPDWESFSPANRRLMWPLAEYCAERGLPITFHAGYYPKCEPLLFLPLAEAFPKTPIFLKHIGYHYWRDAIIVARHTDNVYLETAGNTTSGEIMEAIKQAGAHRVVYGSDLPYIIPEVVIAKITGLPISDRDKALVLGENIQRIHKNH